MMRTAYHGIACRTSRVCAGVLREDRQSLLRRLTCLKVAHSIVIHPFISSGG
jgi:hypothetical protein